MVIASAVVEGRRGRLGLPASFATLFLFSVRLLTVCLAIILTHYQFSLVPAVDDRKNTMKFWQRLSRSVRTLRENKFQENIVINELTNQIYTQLITLYSSSCLGQETAKGPCVSRVKLSPTRLSTTHRGGNYVSV